MATDKEKPIAGIIIAAGGSSRLGRPKQLLEWQGKSFINRVIETALTAGLSPVVVVLGANYNEILETVEERSRVTIMCNENWQIGQSSSLKLGLQTLGDDKVPFIFLLVDQPRVPVELLKELVADYCATSAEIVVTKAEGRRTPPILFDPICRTELMKLRGDEGGRKIIGKFITHEVICDDPVLVADIDTDEDYRNLIKL